MKNSKGLDSISKGLESNSKGLDSISKGLDSSFFTFSVCRNG